MFRYCLLLVKNPTTTLAADGQNSPVRFALPTTPMGHPPVGLRQCCWIFLYDLGNTKAYI
jgi:hypothetical protein